jgi:hypothetical protein
LVLTFPDGWLQERPLTRMDFEEDEPVVARLGYEVVL